MKKNVLIFPCVVLCAVLCFHDQLTDLWWYTVGPSFTRGLQTFFKMLFGGSVDALVESDGVLRVVHPQLTLLVNRFCSGFDGVLLFSILFFLAYATKRAALTVRQWLSFFWGGIVFMILVNACRVVLLFTVGIWLREWFGFNLGSVFLRNIAHAHAGWITYSAVLAIFFPVALRWFLRDRRSVRCTLESNQRALSYR